MFKKFYETLKEALSPGTIEHNNKLFDCLDSHCKNLGFKRITRTTIDDVCRFVIYELQGNYKHTITFSTESSDNLTWQVFKDEKCINRQTFSWIFECEDIERVFKETLYPAIEGME